MRPVARSIKIGILLAATGLAFAAGQSSRRLPDVAVVASQPPVQSSPSEIVEIAIHPAELSRVNFLKLFQAVQSASEKGREEYLKEIIAIKHNGQRRSALLTFFRCLASVDTECALRLLREITDPDDFFRSTGAVLAGAPATVTPKLVAMLMDLTGELGERCRTRYLNGQLFFWSSFDPVSTVQFINQHSSGAIDFGKNGVLGNWAEFDPAAAVDWLQGHPDLQQNAEVINDLVWGLFRNDPDSARGYVASNATDERFAKSIPWLTRRSFFISPEYAEDFVRELPTPESRSRAIYGVASTDVDLIVDGGELTPRFEEYGDWILRLSNENWGLTLAPLLTQWIKHDAAGLLNWLSRVPEGTIPSILQQYSSLLTDQDLPAVFSMQDSPLKNNILKTYVTQLGAGVSERIARVREMNLSEAQIRDLVRVAESTPVDHQSQ